MLNSLTNNKNAQTFISAHFLRFCYSLLNCGEFVFGVGGRLNVVRAVSVHHVKGVNVLAAVIGMLLLFLFQFSHLTGIIMPR